MCVCDIPIQYTVSRPPKLPSSFLPTPTHFRSDRALHNPHVMPITIPPSKNCLNSKRLARAKLPKNHLRRKAHQTKPPRRTRPTPASLHPPRPPSNKDRVKIERVRGTFYFFQHETPNGLYACATNHPFANSSPSKINGLLLVGAEAGLQAAVLLDQDHVLLHATRKRRWDRGGRRGGSRNAFNILADVQHTQGIKYASHTPARPTTTATET